MLTEKQMKSLPIGEYRNADLNRVNRKHCVGKGMKPEYHSYILTQKDKDGNTISTTVMGLKNRQQRRK